MATTTTTKLTELVDSYRQQLSSYQVLLALAEEQRNSLDSSNYQVLVPILERRNRVAGEIAHSSTVSRQLCREISAQLGLGEINLSSLGQHLSEDLLQPLAGVLSEITSLVQQVQTIDQQSEQQLKQVLNLLRGQRGEVERGQAAVAAYQRAQPGRKPNSGT